MRKNEDAQRRIEEIQTLLGEKETELELRCKRRAELECRQTANEAARQRFIMRNRLDIMDLESEINRLRIELGGLRGIPPPAAGL